MLERVELIKRAGDRVSGYSTGMRQRLGIAAALLRAPRLLLLDEPTAGLDPAGVREVGRLVTELSSTGTAVLISSHQISEVEDVCDGFTVLRRGQVVWNGTAAELRAQAPGSAYAMRTSDDRRAIELGSRHRGISVDLGAGDGLTVTAEEVPLDEFVLALGRDGVAVRGSSCARARSNRCFSRSPPASASRARRSRERPDRKRLTRAEARKLRTQLATRVLALICVLGPFAFAGCCRIQSGSPADTLFGVWVHSSGFAVSLVVLGFAGSWGFPLIAGVLAGDIFSSEDRYGTWKTVLTRSCTRRDLFAGKVLAAATFAAGLMALLRLSSLARRRGAGRRHPLVRLERHPALAGTRWGWCSSAG